MKYKFISALVVFAGLSFSTSAQKTKLKLPYIELINHLEVNRPEEPVSITRAQLEKLIGRKININKFVILRKPDGTAYPAQIDDLEGDGIWDELAFTISLPAEHTEKVYVDVTNERPPGSMNRAHVRLGVSQKRDNNFTEVKDELRPASWKPQAMPMRYQLEGPGWENDKVAFRHYFDARNGKDIFGKRTSEMMLNIIGIPGTPLADYHQLKPWGMDVLKVGNSLGAGAVAMYINGKLYPVKQGSKSTFRILADGPIRAICEITTEGWMVEGKPHTIKEVISIWAGQYWYKNDVYVSNLTPEKQLAVGIVNLKNSEKPTFLDGEYLKVLYNHGKQSENNDNLGMGIILPNEYYVNNGSTPKEGEGVIATDYIVAKPDAAKKFSYYFHAGWELSDTKFAQRIGYEGELKLLIDLMHTPIEIK